MTGKIKILYVDDEDLNLELFNIIFKDKFEILTANSADKGLKILEDYNDIDVVISDMKMPGMNGLEFIEIAKVKYNSIHFFILTGFEITDNIAEAIDKGLIIKCFKKPLDDKEIITTVNEVMGC